VTLKMLNTNDKSLYLSSLFYDINPLKFNEIFKFHDFVIYTWILFKFRQINSKRL